MPIMCLNTVYPVSSGPTLCLLWLMGHLNLWSSIWWIKNATHKSCLLAERLCTPYVMGATCLWCLDRNHERPSFNSKLYKKNKKLKECQVYIKAILFQMENWLIFFLTALSVATALCNPLLSSFLGLQKDFTTIGRLYFNEDFSKP